jgi:hypothetical protein
MTALFEPHGIRIVAVSQAVMSTRIWWNSAVFCAFIAGQAREASMHDWFRRWYVSKAEYLRMREYYADEIAELRARIDELEDMMRIDTTLSLDDSETQIDKPSQPLAPSSHVITVNFRRAK